MNAHPLRAVGMALVLGTATMTAATLAVTTTAQAAVRPAVGAALKAAISLAASGNTSAAMAKLRQADSTPNLTSGEQEAISQTKAYIEAKSGNGAVGSKSKFTSDYNAGRYRQAIADAEAMRKSGSLDFQTQIVVGQAYYLSGDYAGAIRYLKGLGNSDQVLELILSAAYKSGDSEAMRQAAEQLVLSGKTQYWTNVLTGAENSKGLKDHQQLDLYRLRFATNNMRSDGDYMTAAELAIEFGASAEAVNILQKGIANKTLSGERVTRLLGVATGDAAKDAAGLANAQKAAAAAKSGDADLKIGEQLTGDGKAKDAIAEIQAGIAKGVTDKGDAQMRLGQAYLAAGQKDDAIHAFNSIKSDPAWGVVAHVWSIYAHTSK
ncbi:MAG TPA: tetratricopeptide repeat protein [Rhizomicrobium sp.]|jgi:tetratricopeptide (TPR) repeat protein